MMAPITAMDLRLTVWDLRAIGRVSDANRAVM
jgi:hypothetical protein